MLFLITVLAEIFDMSRDLQIDSLVDNFVCIEDQILELDLHFSLTIQHTYHISAQN